MTEDLKSTPSSESPGESVANIEPFIINDNSWIEKVEIQARHTSLLGQRDEILEELRSCDGPPDIERYSESLRRLVEVMTKVVNPKTYRREKGKRKTLFP